MIIVITHDPTMRDYYGSYITQQQPNYQYWQRSFVIDGDLNQIAATAQIAQLLTYLRPGEPLCLVGHGNDDGIGDDGGGWWWDSQTLTQLFAFYLPNNYQSQGQGQILLESCGGSVANLPPRIANALDGSWLRGLWLYGHQYAVGIVDPLPSAQQLGGPYYPGAQVT